MAQAKRKAVPKAASGNSKKPPVAEPAPKDANIRLEAPKEAPPPPAQKDAAAKKPAEKDELEEAIISPISGTWGFLKSGPLSLYMPLLKLNVVRTVAYMISVVILFAGLFGITLLLAALAKDSAIVFFAVIAILGIIGGLLILWMVQSFESAAFVLVASKLGGKGYSMRGALGLAAGPTLRYALIDLGLRILLMAPGLLLFALPFAFLPAGSSWQVATPGLIIAYVLFLVYYFVANLIYEFLMQFWRYGFLIEGRDVVESFHRGLSLVRRFFVETLFFDLVYAVAFLISSIPSFIFGVVIYFILLAVQIVSLMALGLWGYAVYFLAILATSILAIAFSTIMETVCRPLHYLFWKGISARMGEKKD